MTNDEVLDKLLAAGYKIKKDKLENEDEFSTEWKHISRYDWSLKQALNYYDKNYMIPLDVFKKHVNPRFKAQFPIGSMVRVSQKSKRQRVRNKFNQAIGDSQDFRHLGIGTGKQYMTEKLTDALEGIGANRYGYNYGYGHGYYNTKIVIGNNKYVSNILAATNQAKAYEHAGVQRKATTWQRVRLIQPRELLEFIEIKGDGIFGPKRLFNGYVTEVFVHFIHPRWNTKREARYEITFETGAKGIWTNDYITRVWDNDFEIDEALSGGCDSTQETCPPSCKHRGVHNKDNECEETCFINASAKCHTIYDYTNLFDTTHGTALELENEDK
jgi:hypothetical protein